MSEAGRNRTPAFALLLVGAVAAGGAIYVKTQVNPSPADIAKQIQPLQTRAEAALTAQRKALEPLASEAARVPQIAAAFDNGVDAATFQDLFLTEGWWERYRTGGMASALFAGDKVMANVFVEKDPPRTDAIVRAAAGDGVSSGLVRGDGRLYLLAASRIEGSAAARAQGAVVLVGKVLDDGGLSAIADAAGAAVGLSDGATMLALGGAAEGTRALGQLLGREAGGAVLTEGGLPAAAAPVSSELWLWTVGNLPARALGATNAAAFGLGGLSLALLVVGVIMLLRAPGVQMQPGFASGPPASAPTADPDPSTGRAVDPTREAAAIDDPATANLRASALNPSAAAQAAAPPVFRPTMVASGGASPAVVNPELAATMRPNVLGRYTMLDKIGEGGMAEVFKATLHGVEGFERKLVVKRLLPNLASFPDAVSQFIDEARLQAELVHSNIVPVFDFGRAGNDYFLALEYISGRDLDKVVARHIERTGKPLPVELTAHIMREVLTALQFAHTRTDKNGKPMEIVHRDVSLGNVLVSYQGEVKLSDFGIAKAERRVSRTQIGMVKGNTAFMSPEQARGEPVDARADVFSAGVVTYCCLTGESLYKNDGETPQNNLLRAAVGPGTQQHRQLQRIAPEMAGILEKAMAPARDARFASAAEFAQALRPWTHASREDLAQTMRQLFAEEMQREE